MARNAKLLEQYKHKLTFLVEYQPVFNLDGRLVRFNPITREMFLPEQKEKHSDIIGMGSTGEVSEPEL